MTNLLERIRGVKEKDDAELQNLRATDEAEFLQIAIRDLSGTAKDSDADNLVSLMESLDRNETDYASLLESLKQTCRAIGEQEFIQQAIVGLEEKANEAARIQEVLESLVRRLYPPRNMFARLSDRETRVASQVSDTRNKLAFMFDDDGNANPSLRPLIESVIQWHSQSWEQLTQGADGLLIETKFIKQAEAIASERKSSAARS